MTSPTNSTDDTGLALNALPALSIGMIIITGILLAGMDATAKYLTFELPVLFVLWGRYFFHTVITFSVYAGKSRSFEFLRARRPMLQLIRAGALFGATSFMYVAITKMPLGDAATIQFFAPVLVTVISGIFLGEHVGPRRIVAVVIAFVGVMLVARPGSGVLGWWALLPLATAFLLALYMVMTRVIRTRDKPAATTFYSTAVGAVVLSIMVPFFWQELTSFQWLLMVTMGTAGAMGHFLLVKAFHSAEASMLAPFTYSQVIGAIFWGFIVFADVPSMWSATGATLIIGSGIYVWYRETRASKKNK